MKTFFIGDVHGCLDELKELLDKLSPSSEDTVMLLGDFLDKGPYGHLMTPFLVKNNIKSILGNHEERFQRYRKHVLKMRIDPKYKNPMKIKPELLDQVKDLTDEEWDYISNLPITHQVDNLLAVHGGISHKLPLEKQDKDILIRLRWVDPNYKHISIDYDKLIEDMKKGIDIGKPTPDADYWINLYAGDLDVVYGHHAHSFDGPHIVKGKGKGTTYGLDTACVYGGKLTAMIYDNETKQSDFVSVKSKKIYS
jgi:bis(5'-nucleosyl)-tetraphosphatase (symmetrical)